MNKSEIAQSKFVVTAFCVFNSGFFQYMSATRLGAEEWVRHFCPDSPEVEIRETQLVERAIAESQAPKQVSIEVFQHDWLPGFAAFHDDGRIADGAKAHVALNLGSLMSAVQTGDLSKADLPYMIAESLMHEAIHALEAWAKVEFSEDRVEELLTKYREKYEKATVWEYTGGEPH